MVTARLENFLIPFRDGLSRLIGSNEDGRPSFNILQNYGSASAPLFYYVFNVLMLGVRDVMAEPLDSRRELLHKRILPRLSEPIRYDTHRRCPAAYRTSSRSFASRFSKVSLPNGETACRNQGQRSGAWQKIFC
jgi:hypothetical protein